MSQLWNPFPFVFLAMDWNFVSQSYYTPRLCKVPLLQGAPLATGRKGGKVMWSETVEALNPHEAFATISEPPKPNTKLSFGDGNYDLVITFRRTKPLNKFQIWMYKVCFGIRARNI